MKETIAASRTSRSAREARRSSARNGSIFSCRAACASACVTTGPVKKNRTDESELQRHQVEARLQHHAEDQQAGADRVDDAGRVHAGEQLRHAHEPDGADDDEERAREDQKPAHDVEERGDHGASSSLGVVGEVAVAEELQHRQRADQVEEAVGEADVEEFRPAGEEADDGEQQDGERADGVAGEHAVEHRRAPDRARDDKRKRDQDRGGGGDEHQAPPSNLRTRASMPPASRSSAPSLTSACTVSSLPLTPTVMVPGVSVMELA